jgi:hypothetical protein
MYKRQAELCERIAHTLASAPIHDHLGYEALAYLKLPGPDYRALLSTFHNILHPELYVEIGVRRGDTVRLALPETRVVGIDPAPQMEPRPNTLVGVTTSDDFFSIEKNRMRCFGFDLALIDGDHAAAQVRKDFLTLERLAKGSSIICLHDIIPMDERTAQPKAEGVSFHTGDAWRVMAAIVEQRWDLIAFTVACPPTGLGIVGRFNDCEGVEIDYSKPFPSTWDEQVRALNIVQNDPREILAALGQAA